MTHLRVVPTYSDAHYSAVYGLTVEDVEVVEVRRQPWWVRLIGRLFTSFRTW